MCDLGSLCVGGGSLCVLYAAFDVSLLGFMEVRSSAGSVVYVFGKLAAICVRNGVIVVFIMSVNRMVSGVLIMFWI